MPSLRDLVRAVQLDLPITVRMDRWLANHNHAEYSPYAIAFAQKALTGEVGGSRTRQKGFRASAMGACARKRVFSYLGTPARVEKDSKLSNIFLTGHFLHLKWQMVGLTEGWLAEAEIPLHSELNRLGGTADGFLYDGSLFEYKSINSNGYRKVADQGPRWDHLLQTGAYKVLEPSLSAVSIVYENKDTGEWREYRRHFTAEVMDAVHAEITQLNAAVDTKQLPSIKPDCVAKIGSEYRNCPFRDVCLSTKGWPDDQDH